MLSSSAMFTFDPHVINITLGPLRLFWQDWAVSGGNLILEFTPVFTHHLLSLCLVTEFRVIFFFLFLSDLVRSLLGTRPLTYTPLSPPILCKGHGENGPSISEMHEEVPRFILGPVSREV